MPAEEGAAMDPDAIAALPAGLPLTHWWFPLRQ